ncbi:hypothetical protein BGZ99_002013 [Dissophora globulifera]|uniref:Uncharacterized protein n=1 Tax=Dissophora globulifera TaxID=979702 RepID=A0A9P6UWK8_9FUNG|nr:hypothetical protein BGZ99_002013 [Dissophora globulifera]
MLRPLKLFTDVSDSQRQYCAPAPPSSSQEQHPRQHPRPAKATRQIQVEHLQATTTPTPVVRIASSPKGSSTSSMLHMKDDKHNRQRNNNINHNNSGKDKSVYDNVDDGQDRYLMYIPYAGVTNQLISIWHGSLIAKALNRTLLIPNLSPNVHVETAKEGEEKDSEPAAPTRWSDFFDLESYAAQTGLKMKELDEFLKERGIVEETTKKSLKRRSVQKKRSEDTTASVSTTTRHTKSKRTLKKKRWIQFGSQVDSSSPSSSSSSSSSSGSTTTRRRQTVPFPTVQKCYSEAGYGFDRRIDMTGRLFMQRYNIDPTLMPTPFLDPERDNKTIWSRWRMDKVIERYQQPEFQQQEILCLGHVYRLLPGGINRAWTEFGQHFRYTPGVHAFVDEVLDQLLGVSTLAKDESNGSSELSSGSQQQQQQLEQLQQPRQFVGVHLRRGDFYRHCLGITSPADPNGWNRCYPSTGHIISLLDNTPTVATAPTSATKWPVLVLTNERDPAELAKADAENWIRVDHEELGTLDRFGPYGPILIDGALLARAQLLVGVEYSTYFKTASKRAESWFGGQSLFVT